MLDMRTLLRCAAAIAGALMITFAASSSAADILDDWTTVKLPPRPELKSVTLAPSTEAGKSSGLTFHYPPYAVGPYAEGQYVAFVPWETLKAYLSPEGVKIFGRARLKGDDDDTQ